MMHTINMKTPEDWATIIGTKLNIGTLHQSDLNIIVQAIQKDALSFATNAIRQTWAESNSNNFVLINQILQPIEDLAEQLN